MATVKRTGGTVTTKAETRLDANAEQRLGAEAGAGFDPATLTRRHAGRPDTPAGWTCELTTTPTVRSGESPTKTIATSATSSATPSVDSSKHADVSPNQEGGAHHTAARCADSRSGRGVPASEAVEHPHVRFPVEAHAVLDSEGCEPEREDVLAVLREGHAGPPLPIVQGGFDPHRLRLRPQDGRSQAGVDAQPRVEWQGVGALPVGVSLDRSEWVAILVTCLLYTSDAGDE